MNQAPRSKKLSHIEMLTLAGLVLFLSFLAYMTFDEVRHDGRLPGGHLRIPTIANNLRILELAKEEWALEHAKTNGALPTTADLAPYLKGGEFPEPVAGEIYTITPVGELNTVTLTSKVAKREAGCVLTVTNF